MEKANNLDDNILDYHCPRCEDLPKIELYMDQLVAILNEYLAPFHSQGEDAIVTATMINNYVKQKVIHPPKNKKYNRSHIMYLIVVGVLKNVLSISDIAQLIKMQINQYPLRKAYNFFAIELENVLNVTFGTRDFAEANSVWERTHLQKLVRSALLSFANKVYIRKNLSAINNDDNKNH